VSRRARYRRLRRARRQIALCALFIALAIPLAVIVAVRGASAAFLSSTTSLPVPSDKRNSDV
jgi:hypothetical protein